MFGRWLVGLLAILLFGQPASAAARDYEGADGGTLIYSVSTLRIAMNFTFKYRRLPSPAVPGVKWDGTIACKCVGFFQAQKGGDYTGQETGQVKIERLPPGDYEIYDFGFGGTSSFSSRNKFSLRFTIRPGEATYIGNYARSPSLGTPLAKSLGALGFFIVSSKAERDLRIARARRPDLAAIAVSVPDVTQLGHPFLLASEPAR
jgi:hypothetical protein